MKHFLFIESLEDEAPFPYFVVAENLVEAIHLLAEAYIDPEVAWEDLDALGIDPSVYSKEELLIMGLKGYIDYFTAYEVSSSIKPDSPDCWASNNITEEFSNTLTFQI